MKQRWAALVTALALSAFVPCLAMAQTSTPSPSPDRGSAAELGQNTPNPFTADTRIPFTVGDYPTCSDPGRSYQISLRVYDILSQLVAVPILQSGSGSVTEGKPLENIKLSCGQYVAYWDAKNSSTGQQVMGGIYLYRLEVDGRPITKKMLYSKLDTK